jgi:SAM-dependent methyltransferase
MKSPAWWHSIEVKGVTTPGITPPASQKWISSVIEPDLRGKEVLDIGAWDGYYSFLAESRGAKRVVAIDPYQGPCKPEGFRTAKQLLNSKVEHHVLDVYSLNKIRGTFDRVFFFGVYYHLEDPILALHMIFKKLKPGGIVYLEGLVRSGTQPYLYAYRPGIDLSPGDYCAATIPWFELVGKRIGYNPVKFLSRYPGDSFLEIPVRALAWYGGLHWGKLKKAHRALIRFEKPKTGIWDEADTESRDAFLSRYITQTSKPNSKRLDH